MKKIISFLLIFVLNIEIFTSCASKDLQVSNETTTNNQNEEQAKINTKNELKKGQAEGWNYNIKTYKTDIKYTLPVYTPNVKKYSAKDDLSDVFNISQFTGFSDSQKKEIAEKGFVIVEPPDNKKRLKMHYPYEELEYSKIPVFVTTDIMLYLYHVYYNNFLMNLESSVLYEKLKSLSLNMYNTSLSYYNDDNYINTKDELKYICAYFLTACELFNINNIDKPEEIETLASEEIRLINNADNFSKSPILDYEMDYSQYTVRGHYTSTDILGDYFKVMMWYGNSGFVIWNEAENDINVSNSVKSMIMTCITMQSEDIIKDWESIYSVTSLFSNESDDLNIYNIKDVITNVYGENPDINLFKNEDYYINLKEEINKLPEPMIQGKFTQKDTPVQKQFRFMGQRYSLDAQIMQSLMEPIVRPVPNGLDVSAALGNEKAEELVKIYDENIKNWNEYENELYKMKETVSSLDNDFWSQSLYNGWLWSIQSANKSFENTKGMPFFMQNENWTLKNINSALGSYAELKHDNVLYSKQPVAEKGGGEEYNLPFHYVEPNPELYSKLLFLVQNTKENLLKRDMINEEIEKILTDMEDTYKLMFDVSIKELTNEKVTREEFNKISYIGGLIDSIDMRLNFMIQDNIKDSIDNFSSFVISDVATIAPNNFSEGSYLEMGTAAPYYIYVLCNLNDKTFIAKGAVYNYYEFLSDKRLTNDEWLEKSGYIKAADEYAEYIEFNNEKINLPEKPSWLKSIINTEKNDINESYEGIDWGY